MLESIESDDLTNHKRIFDEYIAGVESKNIAINIDFIDKFTEIIDSEQFHRIYPIVRDYIYSAIGGREVSEIDIFNGRDLNNKIGVLLKLIQSEKNNILEKSEDNSHEEMQELYGSTEEDTLYLAKYAGDMESYESLLELFFSNPENANNPDKLIELVSSIQSGIFSLQDHESAEIYDKEAYEEEMYLEMVDLLVALERAFKNCEWTGKEYSSFLNRANNINPTIIFKIIDTIKGKNSEIDNMFNEFITENKRNFMLWKMCNGDYKSYSKSLDNNGRAKLYTDNDLEVYTMIVDELIRRQPDKNIRYIDITSFGKGLTSSVMKVGDYVVKCGTRRVQDKFKSKIPNHRRILQPIIRRKNEHAFFEVADAVDAGANQEEVDKIFNELLNDGIAWGDPKGDNLGILKRKNVPRHNIQKKDNSSDGQHYIDDESSSSEVATGIHGNIEGQPLDKGDTVIIDTDIIVDLKTISQKDFNEFIKDCMYQGRHLTHKMIDKFVEKYKSIHEIGNDIDDKQQNNER